MDFPTTIDAFDASHNGGSDAFLTKLNVSGSALLNSTFFGGGGNDEGRAVTTSSSSSVYLTGRTTSGAFPITAGVFQPTIGGGIGGDAFVLKLSNRAPSTTDDSVSTDEDVATTIEVLTNDNDPDGDSIMVSQVTQGTNGSVVINPTTH